MIMKKRLCAVMKHSVLILHVYLCSVRDMGAAGRALVDLLGASRPRDEVLAWGEEGGSRLLVANLAHDALVLGVIDLTLGFKLLLRDPLHAIVANRG